MQRPTDHQLHMLAMFSKGWRFRIFNKKRGSWNTYWALRRKGLCRCLPTKDEKPNIDVLTEAGHEALRRWWK